jgi:hypothetical protein
MSFSDRALVLIDVHRRRYQKLFYQGGLRTSSTGMSIHSFIDFRIRAKEALSAMSVIALHLPAFRKR